MSLTIVQAGMGGSGNPSLSFPSGAGTVAVQGLSTNIVSGTAQASTSGTAITFTGIPSYAKRITVMFQGVSTSGTSNPIIQLGSGSATTSGYNGATAYLLHIGSVQITNYSSGFALNSTGQTAATTMSGNMILALQTGNVWTCSFTTGWSNNVAITTGGGHVSLSGTLDRVILTTVNGTDTFDAGSINIQYE